MMDVSRSALTIQALVVACLAAVLMLPAADRATAAGSEEGCLTASINSERRAQGARSLTTHSGLVSIARRHSARMAEDQRYYHNSNLRNELPSGWRSEGENVGWATDCGRMHNFFMNSPSHRKNILNPVFNQIGVGVVVDSAGKLWVTEVFMQSSGEGLSTDSDAALQAPEPEPAPAPAPVTREVPAAQIVEEAETTVDKPAPKPSTVRALQSKTPVPSATASLKKAKAPSPGPAAGQEEEALDDDSEWDDLVIDPVPIIFDLEPSD